MLVFRDDGLRAAAATFGLGLATGFAGLLSASIGFFLGGMAVAAAAGALLLLAVVASRTHAAGLLGTLRSE